jgi:SHS family lactate transporter-like MFS transporter
MVIIDDLRSLNREQRSAFIASLLGWTLDAFDFFLLTFVVKDIAAEFKAPVSSVSEAIFLTLAMRPLGAFVFGWLADRFGRRPVLMADVGLYALFAFLSAFSPNLLTLLVLRALFGFAMGGEWGIGASLTLETIPAKSRGVVSGLLQEGYALGALLAALVNPLIPVLHWRGVLMIGVLPALLVLYVRRHVPESAAWKEHHEQVKRGEVQRTGFWRAMAKSWPRLLYVVVLMTAFNFFSHGTQDLYPTFLRVQHAFSPYLVSALAIIGNVGAIVGGIVFGALSERIGRRRAIVIAALLALPVIPLWAFSTTPVLLGLGAFLIQVAVQGAWGVIPVHLNELSPEEVRGTFPGFAYQLGNLLASRNAVFQAKIAERHGNNYGLALGSVAAVIAVLIALWTAFGPEAKGVAFGGRRAQGEPVA